jgi:cytochrome b involved in lipid metabolism
MRKISWNEIRKRGYIVIHGKVYDITRFLEEHPGGEEILEENRGKDASEIFDTVGHSGYALSLMKNYEIGEIDLSKPLISEKDENNMKTIYAFIALPVIFGLLCFLFFKTK